MDHLSNDFTAVRKWSDERKKTVIIRRLNPKDWTYDVDVVTDNYFDSIELLETTEDCQTYYHPLLDSDRFLSQVQRICCPVKKGCIVRMTEKRKLCDAFDNDLKQQISKMSKFKEPEPIVRLVPDVHFKADKPWHKLSQIQKDHLHDCDKCAYPYYNALPEQDCLLSIYSYLKEKEISVSPYQYLFVAAENFQLGVQDSYSRMNLYYLSHVKKIKKDLSVHCKIN